MLLDTACASGSRRSCAAYAIGNALNAADLVAAIVAPEYQSGIAERVQCELEANEGTRVLAIRRLDAPHLDAFYRAHGVATEEPFAADLSHVRELYRRIDHESPGLRRAVVLWHGVDALVEKYPRHFDGAVETLCAALSDISEHGSPLVHYRAVIVGGDNVLRRLEEMDGRWLSSIRFRYVIVR